MSLKITERLISALSYVTAGWAGVIYYVILYFTKKRPSVFLRFNVLQAIFLALLYFVLAMSLKLITSLLLHIPFIRFVIAQIQYIFYKPFIFGYSLLQTLISGLIIYLVIFSLMGRYPRIYKISKIIDQCCR